jgi:hypothetical protein
VHPVDIPVAQEEATVGELKQYRVTVNGHETIMNLTEEEAKARGGTPVEDSDSGYAVTTKKRTARNKSSAAE